MLKYYLYVSIFELRIDYLLVSDAAIVDTILFIRRQLIISRIQLSCDPVVCFLRLCFAQSSTRNQRYDK